MEGRDEEEVQSHILPRKKARKSRKKKPDIDWENDRSDSEDRERQFRDVIRDEDDLTYPMAMSRPRDEEEIRELNRERVLCDCNECKGQSRRLRRIHLEHIERYGRYMPDGVPLSSSLPVEPPPFYEHDLIVTPRIDPRSFLVNETEGLALKKSITDQITVGLLSFFTSRGRQEGSSVASCNAIKGPVIENPEIAHEDSTALSSVHNSTRLTRHGGRSSRPLLPTSLTVPSRFGDIILTGQASRIYTPMDPAWFHNPVTIVFDHEFVCWGRRWIIRPSTLGKDSGMGLFACEDIYVEAEAHARDFPELFPYSGAVYSFADWTILSRSDPRFRVYVLSVDGGKKRVIPGDRRFIDGDPMRSHNISGFINSVKGTNRVPNVEWVHLEGSHERFIHNAEVSVITVASRSILVGDEIFCNYDFRKIKF